MKKKTILIAILLTIVLTVGIFLAMPTGVKEFTARAGEKVMQIFINQKPSKVKVEKIGDKCYVPLYFPVEKGQQEYDLKVKYDPETKKVEITKTRKDRKMRGDGKCPICGGSGKCQHCYPVGSGDNTSGSPCNICNGTGDCQFCNGTGKY